MYWFSVLFDWLVPKYIQLTMIIFIIVGSIVVFVYTFMPILLTKVRKHPLLGIEPTRDFRQVSFEQYVKGQRAFVKKKFVWDDHVLYYKHEECLTSLEVAIKIRQAEIKADLDSGDITRLWKDYQSV